MENKQLKSKNFLILIILFLLPAYLIKVKYGWVSFNLLELLIGALFLVWIFNNNTKYKILDTRYYIPVILIFAGLFLSTIVSKNYYAGLGIIKGWFVFPIIFAVIFYDSLKRNEKLLSWSLAAIFCSGVFVSTEGVYYWLSNLLTYDGRLRIFFDSPNQLAMFLAPVFLIGLLRFDLEEPRRYVGGRKAELWKIMGLALILLNLYFTKSYGAWLAIAVALIVIFWLKYKEKAQRAGFAFFLIILIIFLGWMGISKYKNIERLGDRSSLASRMMIWKSAGLMLENNPLFGIGPGNFQEKYLEYQKHFPPYLEWAVPQPHSLFLAWWLEAGLIGLVGFILLLVQFFRDNKKAIGINPHTKTDIILSNKNISTEIKKQPQGYPRGFGDGASREIGTLLLGIMIYILIHGLVDTTYWRNDMAILFWTIIAMNIYLADSSLNKLSNADLKSKSENLKTTT